jgi:hypothetical protein
MGPIRKCRARAVLAATRMIDAVLAVSSRQSFNIRQRFADWKS